MSVDIAAIRALAKESGYLNPPWRNTVPLDWLTVKTLCDLAERTIERESRLITHGEDCWRAHDACAAALYRKEHEA